MPSAMEAFMSVAEAVGQVAAVAQLAASSLRDATDEAEKYTVAMEKAIATTSEMTDMNPNRDRSRDMGSSSGESSGDAGMNKGGSISTAALVAQLIAQTGRR